MVGAEPPDPAKIFINIGDNPTSMFLIKHLKEGERPIDGRCPAEEELDREWNHRMNLEDRTTDQPPRPYQVGCIPYQLEDHGVERAPSKAFIKWSRRIRLRDCPSNTQTIVLNKGTPEAAETYGSIEEGAKRRYWSAPSRSKVPPQSQTDSGQPPVQTVEDSNPVLEQDTFHIYCTTIKNDVPKLMGTRGRVRVHRVERVDKSTLDSVLWQCATVVYDISSQSDQLMEAEFVIRSLMDKLTDLEESGKLPLVSLRRFILVSSVMTWALTPPIVTEGTNSELIEEHYKKRRPDPSYGHHFRIENMLLDIGDRFKDNMKVLVICSGCVYGHGEHLLDSLFREVWSNKLTEVPVYGTGNNRIPVIYDADLASVIFQFVLRFPAATRYIFAMETESPTQLELIQAVSSSLSKGQVQIYQSEASLFSNLQPGLLRVLQSDLSVKPHYLTRVLGWKTSRRFVRDTPEIVEEFKQRHNLKPLRLILLGPETVGKRIIAKNLCKYYEITYISPATLVVQYIRRLKFIISKMKLKNKILQQKKKDKPKDTRSKADNLSGMIESENEPNDVSRVPQRQITERQMNQIRDGHAFMFESPRLSSIPFQMKPIAPTDKIKHKIAQEISRIKSKYRRKISHRVWKENAIIRYKKPKSMAARRRRRRRKLKKLEMELAGDKAETPGPQTAKQEKKRQVRIELKGSGKFGHRLVRMSALFQKSTIKKGLYLKLLDKIRDRGVLNMEGKVKKMARRFSESCSNKGRLLSYSIQQGGSEARYVATRLKLRKNRTMGLEGRRSRSIRNRAKGENKDVEKYETQKESRKKECKRRKKRRGKEGTGEEPAVSSLEVSRKGESPQKKGFGKSSSKKNDGKRKSAKKEGPTPKSGSKMRHIEETGKRRKRKEFGFKIRWRLAEGKLGVRLKYIRKEHKMLVRQRSYKSNNDVLNSISLPYRADTDKIEIMKSKGRVMRKMTLTGLTGENLEQNMRIKRYNLETPMQTETAIRRKMKRKLIDKAIEGLRGMPCRSKNILNVIKDRRRKFNLNKREKLVKLPEDKIQFQSERQKFKHAIKKKIDKNEPLNTICNNPPINEIRQENAEIGNSVDIVPHLEGCTVSRHKQRGYWERILLEGDTREVNKLSGIVQQAKIRKSKRKIARTRRKVRMWIQKNDKMIREGLQEKAWSSVALNCNEEVGNMEEEVQTVVRGLPSTTSMETKAWVNGEPNPILSSQYFPARSHHQEVRTVSPRGISSPILTQCPLSSVSCCVTEFADENVEPLDLKVNLLNEFGDLSADESLVKEAADLAFVPAENEIEGEQELAERMRIKLPANECKTVIMFRRHNKMTSEYIETVGLEKNKLGNILNNKLSFWTQRPPGKVQCPPGRNFPTECCCGLPPQKRIIIGKYTVDDVINMKPIRGILKKLNCGPIMATQTVKGLPISLIKTKSITVVIKLNGQTNRYPGWLEDGGKDDKGRVYLCDRGMPTKKVGRTVTDGNQDHCSRDYAAQRELCRIYTLRTATCETPTRYVTVVKVKESVGPVDSERNHRRPKNVWLVDGKPTTFREWTLAAGEVIKPPLREYKRRRAQYKLTVEEKIKDGNERRLRRRRRHEAKVRRRCQRRNTCWGREEIERRRVRRDVKRQAEEWRQRLVVARRWQVLRRARLALRLARSRNDSIAMLALRRALRGIGARSPGREDMCRVHQRMRNERRRLWQLCNSGDVRAAIVRRRMRRYRLGRSARPQRHSPSRPHRRFRRHRPRLYHRPLRATSTSVAPKFVKRVRSLRAQWIHSRHSAGTARSRPDGADLPPLTNQKIHPAVPISTNTKDITGHSAISMAARKFKNIIARNMNKIKNIRDKKFYLKRTTKLLCGEEEFEEMKKALVENGDNPELDFDWKRVEMEEVQERPISYYREMLKSVIHQVKKFGRVNNAILLKLIREKILSTPCQNRGYILDNFPLTYAQAKGLTRASSKSVKDSNLLTINDLHIDGRYLPDYIIKIDAPDNDLLSNEKYFWGCRTTEKKEIHGAMSKLHRYRWITRNLLTGEDFLDELETPCHLFNIQDDKSPVLADTILSISRTIGRPVSKDENIKHWLKALNKRYIKKHNEFHRKCKAKSGPVANPLIQVGDLPSDEEIPRSRARLVKEKDYKKSLLTIQGYSTRTILHVLTNCLCRLVLEKPPDPVDYMVKYIIKRNLSARRPRSPSEGRVQSPKVATTSGTPPPSREPTQSGAQPQLRRLTSLKSLNFLTNLLVLKEPDQTSIGSLEEQ